MYIMENIGLVLYLCGQEDYGKRQSGGNPDVYGKHNSVDKYYAKPFMQPFKRDEYPSRHRLAPRLWVTALSMYRSPFHAPDASIWRAPV